jgi:excisionase family DNA binding protein
MLRISDLVRLLRVSERTVWRLLRAGEFPGATRLSIGTRIPASDVAAWLARDAGAASRARNLSARPKLRSTG